MWPPAEYIVYIAITNILLYIYDEKNSWEIQLSAFCIMKIHLFIENILAFRVQNKIETWSGNNIRSCLDLLCLFDTTFMFLLLVSGDQMLTICWIITKITIENTAIMANLCVRRPILTFCTFVPKFSIMYFSLFWNTHNNNVWSLLYIQNQNQVLDLENWYDFLVFPLC